MRATARHYFDFRPYTSAVKGRVGPDEWDALREAPGPFQLPNTREAWLTETKSPPFPNRASAIADVLRSIGARTVASYGVGAGLLEGALVEAMPDLQIICTDTAPNTVTRLNAYMSTATVIVHDLRTPLKDVDAHLFYRADTELSNSEWRGLFARIHEPVVMVPGELRPLWQLVAHSTIGRMRGWTGCGYSRNEEALTALWRDTHSYQRFLAFDLPGYVLTSSRRA